MALAFACAKEGGENSSSDNSTTNISNTENSKTIDLGQAFNDASPEPANTNTVNIPAGPDGIVHHYICAKMDGGNGNSAGACPVCGAAMAHNSAFHNQNNNANANQNTPNVTIQNPDGTTAAPNSITTVPPTQGAPGAEPPQNSKGVWHYVCPNGCSGGSGGASACSQCGTTLVHNTEYHK